MSSTRLSCCLAAVVATILAASPASAHITLKGREAAIGTAYEAVFVVPHGCAGSATTRIRVQIPEGVIGGEADADGGLECRNRHWKIRRGLRLSGLKLSEGAKEVVWSGGKLPDHTCEEFVISTFLTAGLKPDTMLYFPTVQECEQGVSRWIDIPVDPAHAHDSKWPAPGVKLLPKP